MENTTAETFSACVATRVEETPTDMVASSFLTRCGNPKTTDD